MVYVSVSERGCSLCYTCSKTPNAKQDPCYSLRAPSTGPSTSRYSSLVAELLVVRTTDSLKGWAKREKMVSTLEYGAAENELDACV